VKSSRRNRLYHWSLGHLHYRMNVQLAEFASEGNMLFSSNLLVSKKQNLVFVQQVPELIAVLRGEWYAQIDSCDLRADPRLLGRYC
jgi:hypothetical protein